MQNIRKPDAEELQYFHGHANALSLIIAELESIENFEHLQRFVFSQKQELQSFYAALSCDEFVYKNGFFCISLTIQNQENKTLKVVDITEEQEAIILKMWRQGFSSAQCGRFIGIEQATVRGFLIKKGLLA